MAKPSPNPRYLIGTIGYTQLLRMRSIVGHWGGGGVASSHRLLHERDTRGLIPANDQGRGSVRGRGEGGVIAEASGQSCTHRPARGL